MFKVNKENSWTTSVLVSTFSIVDFNQVASDNILVNTTCATRSNARWIIALPSLSLRTFSEAIATILKPMNQKTEKQNDVNLCINLFISNGTTQNIITSGISDINEIQLYGCLHLSFLFNTSYKYMSWKMLIKLYIKEARWYLL